MIRNVTYTCEICRQTWSSWKLASACEGFPLGEPLPIKVGDTIEVWTRYEGYQPFKVMFLPEIIANDLGCEPDEQRIAEWTFHLWMVKVDRVVQLGKDWFTDEIPVMTYVKGYRAEA